MLGCAVDGALIRSDDAWIDATAIPTLDDETSRRTLDAHSRDDARRSAPCAPTAARWCTRPGRSSRRLPTHTTVARVSEVNREMLTEAEFLTEDSDREARAATCRGHAHCFSRAETTGSRSRRGCASKSPHCQPHRNKRLRCGGDRDLVQGAERPLALERRGARRSLARPSSWRYSSLRTSARHIPVGPTKLSRLARAPTARLVPMNEL